MLEPAVPHLGDLSPKWSSLFGWVPRLAPKLDVGRIAERLKITPQAARKFMNGDDEVCLACYYEGRSLVTSPEELEAFAKTHAKAIAAARRAGGSYAERQLGAA